MDSPCTLDPPNYVEEMLYFVKKKRLSLKTNILLCHFIARHFLLFSSLRIEDANAKLKKKNLLSLLLTEKTHSDPKSNSFPQDLSPQPVTSFVLVSPSFFSFNGKQYVEQDMQETTA